MECNVVAVETRRWLDQYTCSDVPECFLLFRSRLLSPTFESSMMHAWITYTQVSQVFICLHYREKVGNKNIFHWAKSRKHNSISLQIYVTSNGHHHAHGEKHYSCRSWFCTTIVSLKQCQKNLLQQGKISNSF